MLHFFPREYMRWLIENLNYLHIKTPAAHESESVLCTATSNLLLLHKLFPVTHCLCVWWNIIFTKEFCVKKKDEYLRTSQEPLWFYYLYLLRCHFFICLPLINFMPIHLWKYRLKRFLEALPSLWGIAGRNSRCLTMVLQSSWPLGGLDHRCSGLWGLHDLFGKH